MTNETALREEHRMLTRDRIMHALAEEILERGAHEFSVQGVADRASISHRTVYRHYPNREALFYAYGEWLNGQLGHTPDDKPNSLRSLSAQGAGAYARFERVPRLVEAYVRIVATGAAVDTREERGKWFVEIVDHDAGALDPKHRLALAAVLRQVVSSETWVRSREEFGVDGDTLGDVVGWIIALIASAVEAGEAPDNSKQGRAE